MASVTLAQQFTKDVDVDGSLKNRAWDFVRKVMTDPTAPGLHIEPISGSRDSRVRTGRVNDSFRAVMFLIREEPEKVFLLAAIKPHDEANAFAERVVLQTNPVNGVVEILDEPAAKAAAAREAPRPAAERTGPLVGFKPDELEDVGIASHIAARATAAASEEELLSALEGAPPWQVDVLLAIATGTPLDEALDAVGATTDERAPDADIVVALERPGSQMDFVRVDSDDELRRVLEGPFKAWRTFLHPAQRRYAERETYNGAFRLAGGAGTGKTVVAMHRARHLARQSPNARVVLTTYTTTLAHNLRRDLDSLDTSVPSGSKLGSAGVVVRGIDSLAREALGTVDPRVFEEVEPDLLRTGPRALTPLGDNEDRALWQEVLDHAEHEVPAELARPEFLRSEYRLVVLGQGITSATEYARAPRPGRGTRLGRRQRLAIWSLVEMYRRRLKMNRSVSFPELAALAGRALDAHFELTGDRLADHVIVDEAQDLNAGHWKLLRALVTEGPNDLFICEDSHQRIYGEKIVLGRFGIAIRGRSRRLTFNYRTTAQNLRFAIGLLEAADVTDIEGEAESLAQYHSAMSGRQPDLKPCPTIAAELDTVTSTLKTWLDDPDVEPHSIGVLTRSARTRDLVQRGLGDRGVPVHVVSGSEPWEGSTPALLTMHRAKGLEFRKVILVGIDDDQLPSKQALRELPSDERDDVMDRERFLLYVAATRARDELVVTWHGEPSGFLRVPRSDF